MNEGFPKVIQCKGGWFAIIQQGDVGSGPWKNARAAGFALNALQTREGLEQDRLFDQANAANR